MTYRIFRCAHVCFAIRIAAWLFIGAGSVLSSGCGWSGTQEGAAHERHAHALILPTVGSTVRGSVLFMERMQGMQISYNLTGLDPMRTYAFEIHALGDCNAADGSGAGPIFTLRRYRITAGAEAHAEKDLPEGVLPKLHADVHGVATGFMLVPELTLGGVRSVMGRSIVIRSDVQELTRVSEPSAQPRYKIGASFSSRLACGVIRR